MELAAHGVWCIRQRRGQVLFGELLTIRRYHQRQVQVARRGIAQCRLQLALPGGVVEQVVAAHDIGDGLVCIIDHDRQLIGPQGILTLEHHVAQRRRVELLATKQAVLPDHRALAEVAAQPPGNRFGCVAHAVSAPARIDVEILPLFSRTAAGVDEALGDQLLQRPLIGV